MLTGPEQREWTEAIFSAFSSQEFEELLIHRLDDDPGNYTSPLKSRRSIIGDVVAAYARRGEEDRLIAEAFEVRPKSAMLTRLARDRKAAAAPGDADLERLIRSSRSFLDVGRWLERAGRLQVCVCRVEIPFVGGGETLGTGFLVGEDLVMTNAHVVEPLVAAEDRPESGAGARARAADVVCRFDYKVLADGTTGEGATFSLAMPWRVALSANSAGQRSPTIDELDFAILRLAQPAGALPVGRGPTIRGDARGWIALPSPTIHPDFRPHAPLFIIQHPRGAPLKLVLESDAVQSVDANRTRVRYSTNTEPGSSGSPCFDENWNLVAIHHSGDSDIDPRYNEGIPIDTISEYLLRHDLTRALPQAGP